MKRKIILYSLLILAVLAASYCLRFVPREPLYIDPGSSIEQRANLLIKSIDPSGYARTSVENGKGSLTYYLLTARPYDTEYCNAKFANALSYKTKEIVLIERDSAKLYTEIIVIGPNPVDNDFLQIGGGEKIKYFTVY